MNEIRIGVNGQEDELRSAPGLQQSVDGIDAIQDRHRDVRYDDLWPQSRAGLNQRFAIAHTGNDLERRFQQILHQPGKVWMVIRQ